MPTSPIAVISDLHFTNKIKRSLLLEDYLDNQIKRLRLVYKECELREVQDLIITGDVFDVWNEISLDLINKVLNVINDCPCNIYTIVGNHDILQGNEDSLVDSTLGFLLTHSKLSRLLTGDAVSLGTVEVLDWTNPRRKELENNLFLESDYDIIVAHTKIGPKTTDWCASVYDIDIKGAKWLLLGDQHQGHPTVITPSGCKAINPGGFTLKSSDEITRIPKVCFVYPDSEEYVDLPVEINNKVTIHTKQPAKKTKIESTSVSKVTVDEIINDVLKTNKFSKKVVNYLKKRISDE